MTTRKRLWFNTLYEYRSTVITLLIFLILFGVSYSNYRSIHQVSEKLNQWSELLELSTLEGARLSKEFTLKIQSSKIEGIQRGSFYEFYGGPLSRYIYVPQDDCVIEIEFYQWFPLNPGRWIPLSIQKGDAYDMKNPENATILWSADLNRSGTYEAHVPERGWYTVSLIGPVMKRGGSIMFRMGIGWNDVVDMTAKFRVYKGSEQVVFIERLDPFDQDITFPREFYMED